MKRNIKVLRQKYGRKSQGEDSKLQNMYRQVSSWENGVVRRIALEIMSSNNVTESLLLADALEESGWDARIAVDIPLVLRSETASNQTKMHLVRIISEMDPNQFKIRTLDADVLEEILPHGSGIDGDWVIDDEGDHWGCHNYHYMNSHGMYCGWMGFSVRIPKINWEAFTIEWDPDDIQEMEAHNEVCRNEAEQDDPGEEYEGNAEVDVEGIQEMMEQEIHQSLSSYLTGN